MITVTTCGLYVIIRIRNKKALLFVLILLLKFVLRVGTRHVLNELKCSCGFRFFQTLFTMATVPGSDAGSHVYDDFHWLVAFAP